MNTYHIYDPKGKFSWGLFLLNVVAAIVLGVMLRWEFWLALLGVLAWLPQHFIQIPLKDADHQDHESWQFEVVTNMTTLHWTMTLLSVGFSGYYLYLYPIF